MNIGDIVAFSSWSVITAVVIIVISIVYRKFSKQKKDEPSSH